MLKKTGWLKSNLLPGADGAEHTARASEDLYLQSQPRPERDQSAFANTRPPSRSIPLVDSDKSEYATTQFSDSIPGSIGNILSLTNSLSEEQVNKVLEYQHSSGLKFGEAAVSLGYVKSEDVMWALSQQFHYSYSPASNDRLSDELVVAKQPFGKVAEQFRDIRSQLLMTVLAGDNPSALSILSPNEGDGKSFFSANLAVSFSQMGARTLLIDGNLRNPRQHNIFGASSGGGLSSMLSGRVAPNVMRPIKELPNLFLMPAGPTPPNPLELVQHRAFAALIKELARKFDYILVDTPAAQRGADARVIASRCGAALAIGKVGRSAIADMQVLVKQISKDGPGFAGIVMNREK